MPIYDNYQRRHLLCACDAGHCQAGHAHAADGRQAANLTWWRWAPSDPAIRPAMRSTAGDVGYVSASIKDVADTRVGDTITDAARPADDASARLPQGDPHGVLRHLSC